MAVVSVFVDDAIRGDLPRVCVRTGEPADLTIRMQRPVGGGLSGALWLLLLLGPPGWVAFFVVSLLGPGTEYLTVQVPMTTAAYQRNAARARLRSGAMGVAVATTLLALIRPGPFPALWLVLTAGLLVTAIALQVTIRSHAVGVHLDASRRWVTLANVHPGFVAAVERQEAGTHR